MIEKIQLMKKIHINKTLPLWLVFDAGSKNKVYLCKKKIIFTLILPNMDDHLMQCPE